MRRTNLGISIGLGTTIAVIERRKSRNTRDNKGLSHGGGKWCPVHQNNPHDFDECHVIKKKLNGKLKADIADYHIKQATLNAKDDEHEFRKADQNLAHIFGGSASYEFKRQYKAIEREVNLALIRPPQYLKWLEVLITFNQADHSSAVPHPGRYSVVVWPTILNIKVFRTLVDRGSSLNLIFAKTLNKMGIQRSKLKIGAKPFYGITPNLSTMPFG